LIASKKPGAQVFAYEPIAENIRLFKSNISRNKGLEKKIHLDQKAVTGTEQPHVVLFFDNIHHNTVIASVYQEFSAANKKEVQVDAVSLSKIIEQNNLAVIDLLKLDCEGSEYPILYDSPLHIWSLIKCLAIEVHELDNDKRNCRHLASFLGKKGFEMIIRSDANGCYYLLAYRK
jgi:FkbM family methyltransferase